MMELGVDGTFKRRLKPDATPNVPLASPDPEKKKWRNSFDASVVLPWECVGVEQLEFRQFFFSGSGDARGTEEEK
jgi:hypothetical protein